MLIAQLAGQFTAVLAWFNEGNARLEEFTVPGSAWLAAENHYTASSAAAGSTLVPLSDLVSQAIWNARTAPLDQFEYYEASQAALLVRQDVGLGGTVAILELMRGGQSFDAAFQLVTGRTTADYSFSFPARLKATVPAYPGVALANDTAAGAGVSITGYGFAPATTVTITISAGGSSNSATKVTDGFGVAQTYAPVSLGWPAAGSYTVTVSDGTRTVTATTTLP
jgi:hypothetical protein